MGNLPGKNKKKSLEDESRKISYKKLLEFNLSNEMLLSKSYTDPNEHYLIDKPLRSWEHGIVSQVTHKLTKIKRAMTEIPEFSINSAEDIMKEINILKSMDHPGIQKLYEVYSGINTSYFLITELCEGGDLFDEINNNEIFDERKAAFIMYQLISAIYYCHEKKIVHRNIKPEKILIVSKDENNYPIVKICDFSSAIIKENGRSFSKNVTKSYYYTAPEIFEKKYNEKCDMWSLGVIMYFMLSRRFPFYDENENDLKIKIISEEVDLLKSPFNSLSKNAISLIKSLLNKNPEKRINAEQALNHDWFKENKSKQLLTEISNENLIITFIDNLKKYKRGSILQDTALAFLIHNFSQREDIEEGFKLFKQMDKNGDGKLYIKELYEGLKKHMNNRKEVKELKQDIEMIFKNIDSDNDGYIQYEEFVKAAIPKQIFLNEIFLRFAFNFFDTDQSGNISFDEIKEIFKDSFADGVDVTEALNKIIKEVDTNGDGNISFSEFCEVMTKILD